MDERVQPILARGQYRVGLLAGSDDQSANAPALFVVLDTSGRWLRSESTLELAQEWIDRRLRDEQELEWQARGQQVPSACEAGMTPTRCSTRARQRRPRR